MLAVDLEAFESGLWTLFENPHYVFSLPKTLEGDAYPTTRSHGFHGKQAHAAEVLSVDDRVVVQLRHPGLDVLGGKEANRWGMHDMSGNVEEWTWDTYGSYTGNPTDPLGPSGALVDMICRTHRIDAFKQVLRGGLAQYSPKYSRVSARSSYPPFADNSYTGLRRARSIQ